MRDLVKKEGNSQSFFIIAFVDNKHKNGSTEFHPLIKKLSQCVFKVFV